MVILAIRATGSRSSIHSCGLRVSVQAQTTPGRAAGDYALVSLCIHGRGGETRRSGTGGNVRLCSYPGNREPFVHPFMWAARFGSGADYIRYRWRLRPRLPMYPWARWRSESQWDWWKRETSVAMQWMGACRAEQGLAAGGARGDVMASWVSFRVSCDWLGRRGSATERQTLIQSRRMARA